VKLSTVVCSAVEPFRKNNGIHIQHMAHMPEDLKSRLYLNTVFLKWRQNSTHSIIAIRWLSDQFLTPAALPTSWSSLLHSQMSPVQPERSGGLISGITMVDTK
jgi:hypothetical protein